MSPRQYAAHTGRQLIQVQRWLDQGRLKARKLNVNGRKFWVIDPNSPIPPDLRRKENRGK